MKIKKSSEFRSVNLLFSQLWERISSYFGKNPHFDRRIGAHDPRLVVPLIAAAVVCGSLWQFFSDRALNNLRAQREAVEYRVRTSVIDVQQHIDYALSSLALLVDIVERSGYTPGDGAVLRKIALSNGAITAVQLAPRSGVTSSYPENYELPPGRNLIEAGYYGPANARGARVVVVDQAKTRLLLGVQPVFAPSDAGDAQYWGFATVVYDIKDLVSSTNLRLLRREGYDLRLQYGRENAWRDLLSTSRFEVAKSNSGIVHLPNGDLIQISILPKSGWLSPRPTLHDAGVIASATVLACLLVSGLQRSRRALQKKIEETSTELSRINLQLNNEKRKSRRALELTGKWVRQTRLLLHDANEAIRTCDDSNTLLQIMCDIVVSRGRYESCLIFRYDEINRARLFTSAGGNAFADDVRRNVDGFARCGHAASARASNTNVIAVKCRSDGCPRAGRCNLGGCAFVLFGMDETPSAGMWVAAPDCEQVDQYALTILRQLSHQVSLALGSYEQVEQRKRAEEQMAYLASYDVLTGLVKRESFRKHLERRIGETQANGGKLAVMLVDLDRFSCVNETFGQNIGDQALRQISNRLCTAVRHTDVVARLDGDEFALLISDLTDMAASTRVAQKVIEAVSSPMLVCDHDLFTSASVGISMFPDDGHDADTLITHAECAMHSGIDKGGNRFEYYSKEMNVNRLERVRMEARLRNAAERGEFMLHYQPIVDREKNAIVGAEALLRWQPPDERLYYPGEFIGILEESRLIILVGEWVIRAACHQQANWSAKGYGDLRLSLNVSAQQFHDPHLVDTVARCIEDSGCDPSMLEMELTERVLFDSSPHVIETMSRLKALGVRLSIDDFGTGYSTLTYLTRFPVDTLKIDMSFVRGIPDEPRAKAVISGVIGMAHGMAIEVVAEGVETIEQLEFLTSRRCDLLQGFHFGKAVTDAEFDEMLYAHGKMSRSETQSIHRPFEMSSRDAVNEQSRGDIRSRTLRLK